MDTVALCTIIVTAVGAVAAAVVSIITAFRVPHKDDVAKVYQVVNGQKAALVAEVEALKAKLAAAAPAEVPHEPLSEK